jgi:hypothetical protein
MTCKLWPRENPFGTETQRMLRSFTRVNKMHIKFVDCRLKIVVFFT